MSSESIAQRRRNKTLRADKTLATVLRQSEDSQEPSDEPVVNKQVPWEVEAMEYFNGHLSAIGETLTAAMDGIREVKEAQAEIRVMNKNIHDELCAIKEIVASRSDARVAVDDEDNPDFLRGVW